MKIPNFTPPNKIDNPDLDDGTHDALKVISEQVNKLTSALQKNISPEDNENSETRKLAFENGKEYEISVPDIKGKPSEVRVLDHGLFERVDIAWEVVDSGKIKVALTWPSAPSSSVDTTILIRGGSDG